MRKLTSYLIPKSKIENLISMKEAVAIVEDAFKMDAEGKTKMPAKIYLDFERGDLRCMPAYIVPARAAGVKIVNVHPQNKNLPTVMALIILIDPDTGFPLAVMDGKHITDLRTGAAGAIAAKYLSREDAEVAAFVGAGRQAETQLEGLMLVRPKIKKIFVYDFNSQKAKNFCKKYSVLYGLEAISADSVEMAVRYADLIATTTPSRKPIVKAKWLKPGVHINAIGADAAGKEELDPVIIKKAKIVVDNWEQASHSGEINIPVAKGILTRKDISGTLGEIIIGAKKARTNPTEVTVFDSTGLAIQDVVCANAVYGKIKLNKTLRDNLENMPFLDN